MDIYNKQGRLLESEDIDLLIADKYDFTNCNLAGATINNKIFKDMYFDRADFSGADISSCTFINCYFRGAKFIRTIMEGCTFYKVNFRESDLTQCFLTGSSFERANLIGCKFGKADADIVKWIDCDLRNTNFRSADISRGVFERCRFKGMNTRNCCLNRCSGFPEWMTGTVLQYRLTSDDDHVNTGYKLTNKDSGGIYHPVLDYKVGNTYTVDNIHPITNPGLAIAPLDWILREWVMLGAQTNWKLFKVEFKTGDILGNDGAIKFNVREFKVVQEIPLKQFLDTLKD